MKKTLLAIIAVLFCIIKANAQALYLDEPVFKAGERATYNIYFNLGFIWMHAGDVTFSCEDAKYKGKECYKLTVSGCTRGTFEKFYVVRDTFMSYVDKKTLQPLYYEDRKHEDGYYGHTTYEYRSISKDSTHVKFHKKSKKKEVDDEFNISKQVFDLISCCYYTRCIDTNSLVRGSVVDFWLLYDNSASKLGLSYEGKKTVKIRNGNKYKAMVFAPNVVTGNLFKSKNDLTVYVADDDNHVPLYVEAKLKMGTAVASLEKIEGTKYPMSSKK